MNFIMSIMLDHVQNNESQKHNYIQNSTYHRMTCESAQLPTLVDSDVLTAIKIGQRQNGQWLEMSYFRSWIIGIGIFLINHI